MILTEGLKKKKTQAATHKGSLAASACQSFDVIWK